MSMRHINKRGDSNRMYDYLIVGAGLFGTTFARKMKENGKKCLVIDKRPHIAGNIYSQKIDDIEVHIYGPHIFHTDMENVWEFVNQFASFNHFIYSPIANYHGALYNLPFNMNTFAQMWGITTPQQAREKIEEQRNLAGITEPANLEEQAISLVGQDVYEKLIKGYTQKQWGRPCDELPAFIIKRLPVRYTFDNNYFNHPHQGIPIDGYTSMVQNMLEGIQVQLNTDYFSNKESFDSLAKKVVYTGQIDEYFQYCYGALEYRSLRFETEKLDMANYQGVAGMNYTDSESPYTRIIEHKHFTFNEPHTDYTMITREYSKEWSQGDEPYYPVNDEKNARLYARYHELAKQQKNVIFGGRLADYQYYNMDQVIARALQVVDDCVFNG